MNNNQKMIAATAIAIGALSVFSVIQLNTYVKQLQERFPEIDKKIVRKAYRNMLIAAFAQEYGDLDGLDVQLMEKLFLDEVQKLTTK